MIGDHIQGRCGAARSFADLVQRLIARAGGLFRGDGYRPEKHYMRGPGPKSRARRSPESRDRSGTRS